ncbi:hypothetical protein H5410_031979 [Solanum commersonii]|uniref:Uncharacterized protein n=1 Tax=Solanum commersonii TaxID=4109 RepID=A0A9J5YJV5_SOLCO|nr:hypothetical protein H5410_031979 [Solanum commersonii]
MSPNRGLINTPNLKFKKDVSNSATQDLIMNVHNKTQLTRARINFILKDSSCDIALSKNLKLTILASNESSNSTKKLTILASWLSLRWNFFFQTVSKSVKIIL